jgi:hypothetical protein
MLDVHPPHTSTHSWNDFWVHLGTITAGLLIAIALEQGVEAMHRSHQRKELEHDLRLEARNNEAILRNDISFFRQTRLAAKALRTRAEASLAGKPAAALPPLPAEVNGDPLLPSAGAWTSARDSNELALLTPELSSMYEELYAQREMLPQPLFNWLADEEELANFQDNHGAGDGWLDPLVLSVDDRKQYAALLDRVVTKAGLVTGNMIFYENENKVVANGASTIEELHRAAVQ